jgi:predicted transcriptional regulator
MNTATNPQIPVIRTERLGLALSAPVRLAILGALSDGQPRMVNELARMVGQKPGLVSKHLWVLRWAGMVEMNRRLHQVPAAYIASVEKRHLDFGNCLLRLPDEKGMPTL